MTKHLRFLIVLLMTLVWSTGGAQTTVVQTKFNALSANNINGDKNVSYSSAKGGGTANPNITDNEIRLFQKASNQKYGGTITIKASEGYELQSVSIGSSMATSIAYTIDSDKTLSTTKQLGAGKVYTVTELSANSITFYCMGTSKTTRLYVNKLSVTYSEAGSSNKTSTTLTFPKQSLTYATTDDLKSFTGQTATLTADGTALTGKTITYSKTGDNIFSSFDATNGTLALNGNAGTATVTATFDGSNDDTYASSSASYTITVKEVIKDIATLKEKLTTNYQYFTLKLTDAIVTYKSGDILYIQDKTGGIYCSGTTTLANKDKVNGLVNIRARVSNGQRTITQFTLAEDATIENNVEFTPEVVTLAQLNENIDKYENMRVKVVAATATAAMNNKQTTITQDGASLVLYSKTSTVNWDFVADDVLDIEGYPVTYANNSTKIKELFVYKKSDVVVNSSVVATTLSFDTETTAFDVEKNSESLFVAPKAVVKDATGNVVEGAKITYVSDAPTIASVNENGNVTFGSDFGKATITASYAGDDTHKAAADISYTITYSKIPTEMAWSKSSVSVNIGEVLSAPTLTLTANGENILAGKTIQYSSSNEEVAMIDETGIVLMGKAGSAKISATFAGDDTYAAASAEYTLNVIDPNKTDVTFDFTKPEDYGYDMPTAKQPTKIPDGGTLESNGVVITNVKGADTYTRFTNKGDVITFRVYTGATLTVDAPAGFAINRIDFTDDKEHTVDRFKFSTGKLEEKTWTGLAETLTMNVNTEVFLENMTVNLVKVENVTLNESEINTIEAKALANVTLKRTMKAGVWNTICLPFDVSAEKATTAFGEGVKIAALNSKAVVDANVLSFISSDTIAAATPYLIMPGADGVTGTYTFKGVKIVENNISDKDAYTWNNVTNPIAFKGIYNMVDITTDVTEVGAGYKAAFLGANNTVFGAKQGTMKGFRAYFAIPTSVKASELRVVIDGTATSIKNIDSEVVESNAPVYNLQGQRVDGNNLTPGIYVKAGKKFVVK